MSNNLLMDNNTKYKKKSYEQLDKEYLARKYLTDNEIIYFWKEHNIFKKSINDNFPKFKFYDGPPFATGEPHYGHILASTLKDIIPRYKTQNGYCVNRVFGWDTHGLPIEQIIDKKFNIKTREDVLNFGIENYNNECKKNVLEFREVWRDTIGKLGRWVDFDNDYKTMDKTYMESVWWVFGELYKKKLVYKGVKVMPYSNGCTTPLSNFESKENYKDVSDYSLTIKFKLENCENTYLLVWTTTPWTLPSNLCICVNPDLYYLKIKSNKDNNNYIISKECLENYFKDKSTYEIINSFKGTELKEKKYIPLFNYFYDDYKNTAFKIITDTYVKSTNGTGLVHVAPAFGEDDYRVCLNMNIIDKLNHPPCPLNENGFFTDDVIDFKGRYIKDTEDDIIDYLTTKDIVFKVCKEIHSVGYCYRSDTPLISKAVDCWFINVEKIKQKILDNNSQSEWTPEHIRDNRFHNWIESSVDWCFSRNRYWGNPIPIWISDDGEERVCVSSIDELEDYANLPKGSITDIHSHKIDHITIPSREGRGKLKRIPEIFDCWFESGSMPYAQHGYPKTTMNIDDIFPADFIAEGLDQTRGWFYTLMVISTALFNQPAFKNVIVNGLVLAEDGFKMSKKKKNYPPVNDILNEYGADPIRLYLINGPLVKGESIKFNKKYIRQIINKVNIVIYDCVKYLLELINSYKSLNGNDFKSTNIFENQDTIDNLTDKWILQYTNNFINEIHKDMEKYKLHNVVSNISNLLDKLSKWYLNLNKSRFSQNNYVCLNVFYYCIYHIMITIAPFTPFISEDIYQKIKKYSYKECESVHLVQMSKSIWNNDTKLLKTMDNLISIINTARKIRETKLERSKNKPINELLIVHNNKSYLDELQELELYIKNEINTMTIKYCTDENKYINYKLKLDDKQGRIYKRKFQSLNDHIKNNLSFTIENINNKDDLEFEFENENYKINYVDLVVKKENKNTNCHSEIENNFLVMMDEIYTDEMELIYQGRLFSRFLKEFRKESNLVSSDMILMLYNLQGNTIDNFDKILKYTENNINDYLHEIKYYINLDYEKTYTILDNEIEIYFLNL